MMRACFLSLCLSSVLAYPIMPILSSVTIPSAVTPESVITGLFKVLKITDVNVQQCIDDSPLIQFRQFQAEILAKNYTMASSSLSDAISALSSAVGDCGVREVTDKLDALALSIKFAKISTGFIDSATKFVVGAADLWKYVKVVGAAAKAGNGVQIGNALGQLMKEWTQITGGCGSNKGCQFVDGLIRVFQQVENDIKPCESALGPVVAQFEAAAAELREGNSSANVQEATKDFALALDRASLVFSADACGMHQLGQLIGKLSPKLDKAIIEFEGTTVKVLVGGADVYDNLYKLATALLKQDYAGVGIQCGALLRELRASSCATPVCTVVGGLLASFQLELADIDECLPKADQAWYDLKLAAQALRSGTPGQFQRAVGYLINAIKQMGQAVTSCQVPELAQIAEDMLNQLGDGTDAVKIGNIVTLVLDGIDIGHHLARTSQDFQTKNWAKVGMDLGSMADYLTSHNCNSIACKVVEGLLQAAGEAFADLKICKTDLKRAVKGFVTGGVYFKEGKLGEAVKSWGSSLHIAAKAVTDCGLEKELGFIVQEANLLGFGKVGKSLSGDINIIIHGADFYEELYTTLQLMGDHDWRSAGAEFHHVMDQMSTWTDKNLCGEDFCYVISGIFQAVGEIEGSAKACVGDFKMALEDFRFAYSNFTDQKGLFHWVHDHNAIRKGVKALGDGFGTVAKGTLECHLAELAEDLMKVAKKLGIAPEVGWIETILHILVDGVNIERELASACDGFAKQNWPSFGYNIAQLIKTLFAD